MTFLIIIVAVLVAAAFLGLQQKKREAASLRASLQKAFGQVPNKKIPADRYEKIPAYYLRHKTDLSIDDITWNDLDLDDLYKRIDATRSAAGEEYLYQVLRTPAASKDLQDAQLPMSAVSFYQDKEHEEIRLQTQAALTALGHAGRYSLYDYLGLLDQLGKRSNAKNYLALALPILALGSMYLSVPFGMLFLIVVLIANLLTYFQEKREIEPYIVSFQYLLRLLHCGDTLGTLGARPDALKRDFETMATTCRSFARFRRFSSLAMSGGRGNGGNPLDLILDYLRILFHLDLIKFNNMLGEVQARRADIDVLLTIIGRIDAVISVASFQMSLPVSCAPTFTEHETPHLCVQGLVHPLLTNAVPNDVCADRSVLLTGSNASGKSTFLKAVAIASLLAQTLGLVPATTYEASRFRIYSSMALRDNMKEGDSYFMVEIKSLKRITDAAANGSIHLPVLCFIDEVLRGTNTIERIAASAEILGNLVETKRVLCFAATHDIELTDLLGAYENHHFEEEIREVDGKTDVVFSYKLQDGKAKSRNAIALLSQIGFDSDVTKRAQKRALNFENTGRWQ